MGNVGSTAVVLFVVVLFMAGISFIATDINKNTNLDAKSTQLLIDLGAEYNNNYNTSTAFTTSTSPVTNDSSFVGVDSFARQYLEDKAEVTQKKSTIEKIIRFPDLFLKIFGVESEAILISWSLAIEGLLIFFIGLQIYKAIRTGEVD